MREICSGVHVIIDCSLNQSGSLGDLFGIPGITTKRKDSHGIEDRIHFLDPAQMSSAETEGIHLQTTFYRDKHCGEKVDFLFNLLEHLEK